MNFLLVQHKNEKLCPDRSRRLLMLLLLALLLLLLILLALSLLALLTLLALLMLSLLLSAGAAALGELYGSWLERVARYGGPGPGRIGHVWHVSGKFTNRTDHQSPLKAGRYYASMWYAVVV